MSSAFLIDTNHLGAVATPGHPIRTALIGRANAGDRFGTCIPVICELEAGIQQTRNPQGYRQELSSISRYVRTWPLSNETAEIFGQLWISLRQRGRFLSQVDVMLAALAIQLDLTLLSTDKDFDALPQVRRENWIGT